MEKEIVIYNTLEDKYEALTEKQIEDWLWYSYYETINIEQNEL